VGTNSYVEPIEEDIIIDGLITKGGGKPDYLLFEKTFKRLVNEYNIVALRQVRLIQLSVYNKEVLNIVNKYVSRSLFEGKYDNWGGVFRNFRSNMNKLQIYMKPRSDWDAPEHWDGILSNILRNTDKDIDDYPQYTIVIRVIFHKDSEENISFLDDGVVIIPSIREPKYGGMRPDLKVFERKLEELVSAYDIRTQQQISGTNFYGSRAGEPLEEIIDRIIPKLQNVLFEYFSEDEVRLLENVFDKRRIK
jgi:hypothetical protein